jgi:hypothetical protein
LRIANLLEAARGIRVPWLGPVARMLEFWERGERSEEEKNEYAKAAFLIVWAVLQRRVAEVYERLVEMWEAREEAAAVLKQALVNNDRERWREFYNVLNRLEKAEGEVLKITGEVASELNRIAVNLRAAAKGAKGLEEVARWIEVNAIEARELAEATHDKLSRYSGASYGTRAVAYLRGIVEDNVVGLTAVRAFAAGDLAALVAYTPVRAYVKLVGKAENVRRRRLEDLPLEERLVVELGRVLRGAKAYGELKPLAEVFEKGEARVEKTEKENVYVIYAGGMTAELELKEGGGAKLSGELVKPLAKTKENEAKRAVKRYEEMLRESAAPLPSRWAVGGWLASDMHVKRDRDMVTMETASLEQVIALLSALGVRAGEIHWGEGEKKEKPVRIYVPYFNVTSEGLKPVYRVELHDRYAKEVLDRLSKAPNMSEEERRAVVDLIIRRLDREVLETLGTSPEAYRQKLERWLGKWPYRAPELKEHRVFHTLIEIFRELARGGEDVRRHAVETLLHAVLGDGTVAVNKVVLYIGKGKEMSAEDKAVLYYALLRELGYQPEVYKARGTVRIGLYGAEAKKFARGALPFLVTLERLLEKVKSDEQIYSKVEKMVDMARAERVEARVDGFKKGRKPRARLVVEADGATAEYQIRLHKSNNIELRFNTTNRVEAERRAAVLRAVGVKAEVVKRHHKSRGRDE